MKLEQLKVQKTFTNILKVLGYLCADKTFFTMIITHVFFFFLPFFFAESYLMSTLMANFFLS